MMRTQMFTQANGDRANSPNIGVVITDGQYVSYALLYKLLCMIVPEAHVSHYCINLSVNFVDTIYIVFILTMM